jgi:hypothetical protein
MSTFKVICKAEGNDWRKKFPITKVVTTSKLFGLIKSTKVVSEPDRVPGPHKDEICIVTDSITLPEGIFYQIAGYPCGPYDSKWFVRLDEFTESQKEIAEKSQPVLN